MTIFNQQPLSIKQSTVKFCRFRKRFVTQIYSVCVCKWWWPQLLCAGKRLSHSSGRTMYATILCDLTGANNIHIATTQFIQMKRRLVTASRRIGLWAFPLNRSEGYLVHFKKYDNKYLIQISQFTCNLLNIKYMTV